MQKKEIYEVTKYFTCSSIKLKITWKCTRYKGNKEIGAKNLCSKAKLSAPGFIHALPLCIFTEQCIIAYTRSDC